MTKEQIKQKAEAETDKVIIGSGMDRASVVHLKHLLVTMYMQGAIEATKELEKENAELKSIAEHQQSSNMRRYFENKKLKEGLVVGSTFNKALNSMNKNLEEERDKYRNIVFEKDEQLTKAKEIIRDFISVAIDYIDKEDKNYSYIAEAEQFLKNDCCPDVMCEDCTKEDCGIRQLGLVEVEK